MSSSTAIPTFLLKTRIPANNTAFGKSHLVGGFANPMPPCDSKIKSMTTHKTVRSQDKRKTSSLVSFRCYDPKSTLPRVRSSTTLLGRTPVKKARSVYCPLTLGVGSGQTLELGANQFSDGPFCSPSTPGPPHTGFVAERARTVWSEREGRKGRKQRYKSDWRPTVDIRCFHERGSNQGNRRHSDVRGCAHCFGRPIAKASLVQGTALQTYDESGTCGHYTKTTKHSREESQQVGRTGHRQKCPHGGGQEHGPKLAQPEMGMRRKCPSSCLGLTRGNASRNSTRLQKRVGPDNKQQPIHFETINRDLLLQRIPHTIFIEEHLTPKDKAPMTQAYFTKHTVFLSPTDPDSAKRSARVGLIAAEGIRCANLVARTEKVAFFRQQGRADIYNLDMGSSTALMAINLYGRQGAATNGKTDEITEQQEFDSTGDRAEDHIGRFQHGHQQQKGDEETHK